jgi:hypothetical protein
LEKLPSVLYIHGLLAIGQTIPFSSLYPGAGLPPVVLWLFSAEPEGFFGKGIGLLFYQLVYYQSWILFF